MTPGIARYSVGFGPLDEIGRKASLSSLWGSQKPSCAAACLLETCAFHGGGSPAAGARYFAKEARHA